MFNWLSDTFNNRELAIFVWLSIAFIIIRFFPSIRKATYRLFDVFLKKKLFFLLLISIAYISIVIISLYHLGLWDFFLLKDTIYWFIMVGLVMVFRREKEIKDDNYFKNIIVENLKFTIVINFLSSFYYFSFWCEFAFIFFIVLWAFVYAVIKVQFNNKTAEYVIFGIIFIPIVLLFILSVKNIISSINEFADFDTLKVFLLPISLTLIFIPFALIIANYIEYELLFKRFNNFIKDTKLIRYAKWRSLIYFKLNFKKIRSETQRIMRELCLNSAKDDIRKILRDPESSSG